MSAEPMWRGILERAVDHRNEILDLRGLSEKLGDDGAKVVAERLRGSAVERLLLARNDIGDSGAASLADLLRADNGGAALSSINLQGNNIGREGVETLADALKHTTSLKELVLVVNPGVDWTMGGSEADVRASIDALVSAIGVNTSLEKVFAGFHDHQGAVDSALKDTEGRRRRRELFLSGPMTKAARASERD
jgi:Leucine Rich repeat